MRSQRPPIPKARPKTWPKAWAKALIFDVDGTLAETEELHRKAFNQVFNEFGLNWFWHQQLYGELLKVAGGQNRLRFYMEKHQPLHGVDFLEQVAEMHRRKTAIYGDMLADGEIELRPGIEKLIRHALEQGLKLAIVTSTSRINVDRLFEATLGLDVLQRFAAICCGDDVSKVKPDPEIYFLALKKLNLQPSECLAFEDSELGLQATIAANIPTIITVSTYCKDDDFSGARAVMTDLASGGFTL